MWPAPERLRERRLQCRSKGRTSVSGRARQQRILAALAVSPSRTQRPPPRKRPATDKFLHSHTSGVSLMISISGSLARLASGEISGSLLVKMRTSPPISESGPMVIAPPANRTVPPMRPLTRLFPEKTMRSRPTCPSTLPFSDAEVKLPSTTASAWSSMLSPAAGDVSCDEALQIDELCHGAHAPVDAAVDD